MRKEVAARGAPAGAASLGGAPRRCVSLPPSRPSEISNRGRRLRVASALCSSPSYPRHDRQFIGRRAPQVRSLPVPAPTVPYQSASTDCTLSISKPRRRASRVAVNCHSHCIRSASRLAQTATPKFVSCHPLRPTFPLPSAWSRRRMKFREHIHNRLASRRAAVIRRPRRAACCSKSTRELPGRRSSSTSTCLSFVPPSSTCSGSAAAPKRCHPCGGCGQPEYVADALHHRRHLPRTGRNNVVAEIRIEHAALSIRAGINCAWAGRPRWPASGPSR